MCVCACFSSFLAHYISKEPCTYRRYIKLSSLVRMNNIKNSNRENIQSTLLSDVRLDTEIASTHFCKLM